MKPFGICSDQHCHTWNTFATTNADGVNSRLQITLDELRRCGEEVFAAGGNTIFFAGDLFHVRGSISPQVFNPTFDAIDRLLALGLKIFAVPGNHDLEGKETTELGNAMQQLGKLRNFSVITMPGGGCAEHKVVMVPWQPTVGWTREAIRHVAEHVKHEIGVIDLIIHAPVNGVIIGVPDTGFDAKELAGFGFKRVFAGHYHNHKDFGNGVYSIGALTHQTWSDIGTKAGFLIVHPDRVEWRASHAPEFVEITSETAPDDIPLIVDGNYTRVRFDTITEADAKRLRDELEAMGAAGVVIQSSKAPTVTREGVTVKTGASLEASVESYIGELKHPRQAEISAVCGEILSRAKSRSVE